MDAAAEIGRNPVSLSTEMGRLTRDGTAESVSWDQILRRERGRGNIHFPCLADLDPYSCYIYDIYDILYRCTSTRMWMQGVHCGYRASTIISCWLKRSKYKLAYSS